MSSCSCTLALSLAVLALTSTPAAGQSLQTGKWTGTIFPPNGQTISVGFNVSGEGAELAITMTGTPVGDIEFLDVELTDTVLGFAWVAGNTALTCKLEQQDDGSYEGPCTDDDGVPGTIVMMPPRDG
jgi:hypothetical protein